MALREPNNLAKSFDGEDSQVAISDVSDHQGDSGLAQADTRQNWVPLFTNGTMKKHQYYKWCYEDPILRRQLLFWNLKIVGYGI